MGHHLKIKKPVCNIKVVYFIYIGENMINIKKRKILILIIVSLLAISGGYIDGYTYLLRGGSFATMQTGNLIFLTINLLSKNFTSLKTYLLPIVFFCFSSVVIVLIKNCFKDKIKLFEMICLLIEIIFIIASSFIALGKNNFLSTSLLSIASSVQLLAFSKFDQMSLTTTMCTANLKNTSENLGLYFCKKDKSYLINSLKYLLVIISFVIGVAISYLLHDILKQYSILITLINYILVAIIYYFIDK